MSRKIKIKPWSGYESTADEIVLDEAEEWFVAEQAKHCRCTYGPCEGVLAGGPCDEIIYEDDEDEDGWEDEWWEE